MGAVGEGLVRARGGHVLAPVKGDKDVDIAEVGLSWAFNGRGDTEE